jgi:hypothetical protein
VVIPLVEEDVMPSNRPRRSGAPGAATIAPLVRCTAVPVAGEQTTAQRQRDEAMSGTRTPRRAARLLAVGAVLAGIVASSVLVLQASYAVFSSTTQNGPSTLSAGTVTITDDDTGNAIFSATGTKPGSTAMSCINVSYAGTLAANVRLYATSPTGTLGPFVTFSIAEGTSATGGASLSCSNFSPTSTLFSGTMSNFASAKTNFGNGLSTWAPSGSATRSYRITWTIQDDNNAAGLSGGVTLAWESQNI